LKQLRGKIDPENFLNFDKLLKKISKLFDVLENGDLSVFEETLRCPDDKSAKFISLIWEELELWREEMRD
jgi:hypothetical protein